MELIDTSKIQKGMEKELLDWIIDTVIRFKNECDESTNDEYEIGKKDAYGNVIEMIRDKIDILSE